MVGDISYDRVHDLKQPGYTRQTWVNKISSFVRYPKLAQVGVSYGKFETLAQVSSWFSCLQEPGFRSRALFQGLCYKRGVVRRYLTETNTVRGAATTAVTTVVIRKKGVQGPRAYSRRS